MCPERSEEILLGCNHGWVIDAEFREGNIAPADRDLEFIKQCVMQLPVGRTFDRLRADSASYALKEVPLGCQAAIFDYCDDKEILFTISGRKDESVWRSIKDEAWQTLSKREQVSEFMHTMDKADNAFRMIVVKKDITPILPDLEGYLSEEVMAQYEDERYYCIATNDDTLSAEDIVKLHRQRGETSENKIKELKNGFNMSYLPTSDFEANAFYFAIGTLAHNFFLLFKQLLGTGWQKHTVKTIRYKLYNIAGKVVTHARETILKVNAPFIALLQRIREKAYQVSLE